MIPLFSSILFFTVLLLILGAGYVLWRFVYASGTHFLRIESLLFSFALGITFIDFSMLVLHKGGIPLKPITLFLLILSVILAGILYRNFRRPGQPLLHTHHIAPLTRSRVERSIFLLLFALTIGIKTFFLSNVIIPTATDLGHHLYWTKSIVETHTLPRYQEQEIIDQPGNITLSDPRPIADFIIGEHLPFAFIALLSGASLLSAFPIVFLLIINVLSLLALVALTYRIVSGSALCRLIRPEQAALATLFLCGPLYTLASPQAKFISGGVIGNVFGNFFIPIILLLFLRAFQEKNTRMLSLGILLTCTLAYTHHLSTLVLLYIFVAIGITTILSHIGHLKQLGINIQNRIFAPLPLLTLVCCACFFFFIAMPTYIETNAAGTALGTPTKLTRIGLSIRQITDTAGDARFALGILGIFVTALIFRRSFSASLVIGWSAVLFLMAYQPDWLLLNIPSNRIGTYFSFPVSVAASIGLVWLVTHIRNSKMTPLSILLLFSVFGFTVTSGMIDNGQSLVETPKSEAMLQTFAVSSYLAAQNTTNDVVLKDHNYIVADAWMKHFFMRDYFFPLSRGFFTRYENSDRERCTLDMIAIPNTPRGEACFIGTGVNQVVVNPYFDAPQFEKSPDFSRVYVSDKIHVYAR